MKKSAKISKCGRYRFHLSRVWDDSLPLVVFIMLNPSTADANQDDATIRRCTSFARSWGYGGIQVVNLFAYRSREPRSLLTAARPIGPGNGRWILTVAQSASLVVCAWGTRGGKRGESVIHQLRRHGVVPMCLERTQRGEPKHPLYLKSNLQPIRL